LYSIGGRRCLCANEYTYFVEPLLVAPDLPALAVDFAADALRDAVPSEEFFAAVFNVFF
jgi:hypothetical protein